MPAVRLITVAGEHAEGGPGRPETARVHAVPAYVVFPDATLQAIAQARPRSLDALRGISGVGDKKLERYGDALLALIAEG